MSSHEMPGTIVSTCYKAVHPDGTDFYSRTVQWATAHTVHHPTAKVMGKGASEYLSVSTVPTNCTGMAWPCRLLTVEPVDGHEVTTPKPHIAPSKRAATAWRVTGEVDAHRALGPQGEHVAALIERVRALTPGEARRLYAAWDAARDAVWDAARYAARGAAWYAARDAARGAAWYAARDAAWYAARDAVWDAARYAAWYAAREATWDAVWDAARRTASGVTCALIVRDLISTEHYDAFTAPWRTVIGPIHPDDPSLA